MTKRVMVSLVMLVLLLTLAALSPALLPEWQAAAQDGSNNQPEQADPQGKNETGLADESNLTLLPGTGNEALPAAANPALATFVPTTPSMGVLFDEMTLVWLHSEEYARIIASCAGLGLRDVAPNPAGPMVLIPNAGDLDIAGSTVALKLHPNGQVEFIPRTQGQLIRVPADVGNKVTGEEVLSLSFEEGLELMEEGYLVWTAQDAGPYGTGHGLPGHIATCDPSYPGDDYFADLEDNNTAADNDNDNDNDNDDNDNDNDNDGSKG